MIFSLEDLFSEPPPKISLSSGPPTVAVTAENSHAHCDTSQQGNSSCKETEGTKTEPSDTLKVPNVPKNEPWSGKKNSAEIDFKQCGPVFPKFIPGRTDDGNGDREKDRGQENPTGLSGSKDVSDLFSELPPPIWLSENNNGKVTKSKSCNSPGLNSNSQGSCSANSSNEAGEDIKENRERVQRGSDSCNDCLKESKSCTSENSFESVVVQQVNGKEVARKDATNLAELFSKSPPKICVKERNDLPQIVISTPDDRLISLKSQNVNSTNFGSQSGHQVDVGGVKSQTNTTVADLFSELPPKICVSNNNNFNQSAKTSPNDLHIRSEPQKNTVPKISDKLTTIQQENRGSQDVTNLVDLFSQSPPKIRLTEGKRMDQSRNDPSDVQPSDSRSQVSYSAYSSDKQFQVQIVSSQEPGTANLADLFSEAPSKTFGSESKNKNQASKSSCIVCPNTLISQFKASTNGSEKPLQVHKENSGEVGGDLAYLFSEAPPKICVTENDNWNSIGNSSSNHHPVNSKSLNDTTSSISDRLGPQENGKVMKSNTQLSDLFLEPPPKISDENANLKQIPSSSSNISNRKLESASSTNDSNMLGLDLQKSAGHQVGRDFSNLSDLFSEPPPKISNLDKGNSNPNVEMHGSVEPLSESFPANSMGFQKKKKAGNKGKKHHSKCRISAKKLESFIAAENAENDDFFSEPVMRPPPPMPQQGLAKFGRTSMDNKRATNCPKDQLNSKAQNGFSASKRKNKKWKKRNRNRKLSKEKDIECLDNAEDGSIVLPPREENTPHKWPLRRKLAKEAVDEKSVHTEGSKLNSRPGSLQNDQEGIERESISQNNAILYNSSFSLIDDILSQPAKYVDCYSKSGGNKNPVDETLTKSEGNFQSFGNSGGNFQLEAKRLASQTLKKHNLKLMESFPDASSKSSFVDVSWKATEAPSFSGAVSSNIPPSQSMNQTIIGVKKDKMETSKGDNTSNGASFNTQGEYTSLFGNDRMLSQAVNNQYSRYNTNVDTNKRCSYINDGPAEMNFKGNAANPDIVSQREKHSIVDEILVQTSRTPFFSSESGEIQENRKRFQNFASNSTTSKTGINTLTSSNTSCKPGISTLPTSSTASKVVTNTPSMDLLNIGKKSRISRCSNDEVRSDLKKSDGSVLKKSEVKTDNHQGKSSIDIENSIKNQNTTRNIAPPKPSTSVRGHCTGRGNMVKKVNVRPNQVNTSKGEDCQSSNENSTDGELVIHFDDTSEERLPNSDRSMPEAKTKKIRCYDGRDSEELLQSEESEQNFYYDREYDSVGGLNFRKENPSAVAFEKKSSRKRKSKENRNIQTKQKVRSNDMKDDRDNMLETLEKRNPTRLAEDENSSRGKKSNKNVSEKICNKPDLVRYHVENLLEMIPSLNVKDPEALKYHLNNLLALVDEDSIPNHLERSERCAKRKKSNENEDIASKPSDTSNNSKEDLRNVLDRLKQGDPSCDARAERSPGRRASNECEDISNESANAGGSHFDSMLKSLRGNSTKPLVHDDAYTRRDKSFETENAYGIHKEVFKTSNKNSNDTLERLEKRNPTRLAEEDETSREKESSGRNDSSIKSRKESSMRDDMSNVLERLEKRNPARLAEEDETSRKKESSGKNDSIIKSKNETSKYSRDDMSNMLDRLEKRNPTRLAEENRSSSKRESIGRNDSSVTNMNESSAIDGMSNMLERLESRNPTRLASSNQSSTEKESTSNIGLSNFNENSNPVRNDMNSMLEALEKRNPTRLAAETPSRSKEINDEENVSGIQNETPNSNSDKILDRLDKRNQTHLALENESSRKRKFDDDDNFDCERNENSSHSEGDLYITSRGEDDWDFTSRRHRERNSSSISVVGESQEKKKLCEGENTSSIHTATSRPKIDDLSNILERFGGDNSASLGSDGNSSRKGRASARRGNQGPSKKPCLRKESQQKMSLRGEVSKQQKFDSLSSVARQFAMKNQVSASSASNRNSLLNLVGDAPVDLAVALKENNNGTKDRPKRGGKKKKKSKRKENQQNRAPRRKVPQERKPPPLCKYFKAGKCNMGQDCNFLHEGVPERRELCKYYVSDCCLMGNDCIFMHSDFPCKYHHLYSRCTNENCKYSHEPLTDETKKLLDELMVREEAAKQLQNAPDTKPIWENPEDTVENEVNTEMNAEPTAMPTLYQPLSFILGSEAQK